MATAKRIGIFALSLLFVLISFLPARGDEVAVSNYLQGLKIWNPWSTTMSEDVGDVGNTTSVINWADASNTATCFSVGFKFPMIPNIPYGIKFTIMSDNGTGYNWTGRGDPIAVYMSDDEWLEEDFSTFAEYAYDTDQLLGSSWKITSSLAQQSTYSEFEYYVMSDVTLSYDWFKVISFSPSVEYWNDSEKSFRLSLHSVSVYYDPSDTGAATLDQITENAEAIEELGIKVDVINTQIQQLSEDVNNGLEELSGQIDVATGEITDQVRISAEETQQAIKEEGEKTQQAIQEDGDKTRDKMDELYEQEKEEGQQAGDDAVAGGDEQAGALADGDEVGKLDVMGKLQDFWGMLSSTEVATSITFPGAKNPFTGDIFWEEQQIDLTPWLSNPFIKYLLQLVRIIFSMGFLWWVLKLYYDMVDAVLNPNSERSLIQVVLHLNPFK